MLPAPRWCVRRRVPGNAVVKIGDQTIRTTTFNHWMQIAAVSSRGRRAPTGRSPSAVPEPPNFTACIAQKKKTAPKPAKGQPEPTDAQFKAQCKPEYEGLRDQVMSSSSRRSGSSGEADGADVKVTDTEVKKQFEPTKKQSSRRSGLPEVPQELRG